MPKRLRTSVVLQGEEELQRKLKLLAEKTSQILEAATMAGAEVWKDESNRRAPGPYIVFESTYKSSTQADVAIGPEKAHWYYIFFETGATAHDIPSKKGYANKSVLKFEIGGDAIFTRRVRHTGMAAAPFLRPPAYSKRAEIIAAMKARFMTAVNEVVNS